MKPLHIENESDAENSITVSSGDYDRTDVVHIEVADEVAQDSYNVGMELGFSLTREQALELRDWLIAWLA